MQGIFRLLGFLLRISGDLRFSRLAVVMIAVTGALSGIASTAMLALITQVFTRRDAGAALIPWAYLGLCVALPVFRYISQRLLIGLTQKSLLLLRLRLTRAILGAPLRHLEQIGPHRLQATLTNDLNSIVEAIGSIPMVLMNLAVLVSCLAFLGWISGLLLLEVVGIIVLGVVTYRLTVMRAFSHLMVARDRYDELAGQVRALTEGTKELKMHRPRRRAFAAEVESSARGFLTANRNAAVIFAGAVSWAQALLFVALGLLVFVVPRIQPTDLHTLLTFTVILFQLFGPLEFLLGVVPQLGRAAVSGNAVEQLGFALEKEHRDGEVDDSVAPPDWGRLELRGVTHTYRRENEEESFLLGPLDLVLTPGELIFLVGGNGSGKTTLAKLLVGLYAPESGEVRLDGVVVDDGGRERYREHFSVVFADFFVFERLLGLEAGALDEEALRYLRQLHLDQKVQVRDGVLSTIDLSQGQRKRLALMTAYLEDRPIYVFDEWAADQDPVFKEVFYSALLPALKARGKTVVVISHDDHYFHVADRILKLDYGKIESDRQQPAGA